MGPAPTTPEPEVRAAQLGAVFGQLPLAAIVSVVNAVLLTLVLGARPAALGWLVAALAVSALRLGLWQAYRADRHAADHAGRWASASALSSAAAGLLWGGGAALLWPVSESAQLFWVFVVGGMATGAAALHYAHLPTALAFIIPAGLPIAARLALEGDARGIGGGAMILVFLAALVVVSLRANARFREFALMRLDLRRQAQALDAANARLRQEIEDHRATAATLHHAQKMEALGQLTGGIAHDFNNLLMVVLGSLGLLRKRIPAEDARAARLLDNAMQGANRGAVLTQRLLAFGRRQALRPEVVTLPTLLAGMADLLRRSAGGPNHRIEVRVPSGLPPVLIDPSQLELAVLNLVLNARDAMPAGGTIEIAGREEGASGPELAPGRYFVLAVSDEGEGMDAETLARATEPFFTTKGVGKGTGLGLSMVDGLAAQSGGRLRLRSSKGVGTVAELWLKRAEPNPAAPDPAAEGGPDAAPPPARRRLDVLLVDDDKLVLTSTAAMLEDLGHHVIEAEGARAALDHVRAGTKVDLVLTDYGMPGMNGFELIGALRRLRPGLPAILATGYAEVPEGEIAGVAGLTKPFGQGVLAAAIEASLNPGG